MREEEQMLAGTQGSSSFFYSYLTDNKKRPGEGQVELKYSDDKNCILSLDNLIKLEIM